MYEHKYQDCLFFPQPVRARERAPTNHLASYLVELVVEWQRQQQRQKRRAKNHFYIPLFGHELWRGGGRQAGKARTTAQRWEGFRKCEFELLKCENIMRFSTIVYAISIRMLFFSVAGDVKERGKRSDGGGGKYELFGTLRSAKVSEDGRKREFPFILFPDKIDFYFISTLHTHTCTLTLFFIQT
jgi:hypothetical protein